MARAAASKHAAADDGASAAIIAQQRIFQLKKERDKKLNDVVTKALSDLEDIKRQVSQERREYQQQRKQKKASVLLSIAQSMQKRTAIEEEIRAVIMDMHSALTDMENCMLQAYSAKECEINHMLEEEEI